MENVANNPTRSNRFLQEKSTAWLLVAVSALLMLIDNVLKMPVLIGGWHVVLYITLLMPLLYMMWKKRIVNPYTKWFLPLLGIMIADMFIYNNIMVQIFLPVIFYMLVLLLYLSSMHRVHSVYQTFIPSFAFPVWKMSYIKPFFDGLVMYKHDKTFYARIGTALLITLPFLGIFVALLVGADSHYGEVMKRLFSYGGNIQLHYLVTMPLSFMVYLWIFVYGFSNKKLRTTTRETDRFDVLIVSVFLGLINLLFLSFVAVQIPFLIDGSNIPSGINIADFAREGFFQLMSVMGLVVAIFLFILRRFKGEKYIRALLAVLLVQSIVMGVVSLKKMHLYQALKGATVLRYYVEWFDYFLLLALLLGILFLLRNDSFGKLLNIITVLGLISFTLIVSINIDAMVAEHNIEKFKATPDALDKEALRRLSIDALPVIEQNHIVLKEKSHYIDGEEQTFPWYIEPSRHHCNSFKTYHYGYCSILKKFGK